MPPEKRNIYLDADESDDDGVQGYDSDKELRKGGHTRKRPRVEDGSEDEFDDISSAEEPDNEPGENSGARPPAPGEGDQLAEDQGIKGDSVASTSQPKELPGVSKPLSKKNLVRTEAALKRSGVVYISRLPPYITPAKIRSLLSPYGQLNRIFLSPEDPAVRSRRVRAGGNKKRSFTDGWIEWVDRKEAKRACELLNGRTVGGKKGSYYRDDIWNLIYLRNFKWSDLTAQIAAENAERQSRMQAEISRTKKENKEFVRNVERAKMLEGMKTKKAAKRRKDSERADDAAGLDKEPQEAAVRTFRQIPLAKAKKDDGEQAEQVQRVLSKIF